MPLRLDPKLSVLPAAQREIWDLLANAPSLGFVLYGGTAIALHLGIANPWILISFVLSRWIRIISARHSTLFVVPQCCRTA
jgi:hypothetical protein